MKKVCSIVSYLQDKWKDAIGEQQIRLYPKEKNSVHHNGWGADCLPTLHVLDIAIEISCLYNEDLELEYKIESFLSPRQCDDDFSRPFNIDLSKEIDFTLDKIEKRYQSMEEHESQREEEHGGTFLDLVTSVQHSPFSTNETSSHFFDASRDGFDMLEETKKYEGKCREFWYNREDSVDYSSMFAKKKHRTSPSPSPSPKKRKLSESPVQ